MKTSSQKPAAERPVRHPAVSAQVRMSLCAHRFDSSVLKLISLLKGAIQASERARQEKALGAKFEGWSLTPQNLHDEKREPVLIVP